MDRPDGEFEAFLRQFQPRKPKALPTHRRTLIAFATAALMVMAVMIPMRYGSKGPAADGSADTPASTPPAITNSADGMSQNGRRDLPPPATLNRVPGASASSPAAERTAAPVSASPNLSFNRDVKQPGSPSRGSVNATGSTANRRLSVGGEVKPPRRVVNVNPVYPADAQAAGIRGLVILGIVIGEDGSVIETEVLSSIPELDQAAIDAVTQWQFEPTLLNGEPVEVEMEVTINFTLR